MTLMTHNDARPDKPLTAVDSMFAQAFAKSVDGGGDGDGEAYADSSVSSGGDSASGGVRVGKSTRSTPEPHGDATKLGAQVWTTTTSIDNVVWHYVLSIDVGKPWHIHGSDFWPMLPNNPTEAAAKEEAAAAAAAKAAVDGSSAATTHSGSSHGWVAHSWFSGHQPTACVDGTHAISSGCVLVRVVSAADIPPFHNTRPIMVANDTHRFDLLELAPVGHNGWVLLGEVGRYVRVSSDRFNSVTFTAASAYSSGGIVVKVRGSEGETTAVTALEPMAVDGGGSGGGGDGGGSSISSSSSMRDAGTSGAQEEWVVHVQEVTFGASGEKTLVFH